MPRSYLLTETSPLRHNANCVYCHVDLGLHDHVTECEQCAGPHHVDCWQSNANRCAVFGCTGFGYIGTPDRLVAPQAVQPVLQERSLNLLPRTTQTLDRVSNVGSNPSEHSLSRRAKVTQGLIVLFLYNLGLYFYVPFRIAAPLLSQFDANSNVKAILVFACYTLIMLAVLGVIFRLSLSRFAGMVCRFLFLSFVFIFMWSSIVASMPESLLSESVGPMIAAVFPFTPSILFVIAEFSNES